MKLRFIVVLSALLFSAISFADPITIEYEAPLLFSFESGCSPNVVCGTQDTAFPVLPNSLATSGAQVSLSVAGSTEHHVTALEDMPDDKSILFSSLATTSPLPVSASGGFTLFSLTEGQSATFQQELNAQSVSGIFATVQNGFISDANTTDGFIDIEWKAGFSLGTPYVNPDHSGWIDGMTTLQYSFDTEQAGDLSQQEIDAIQAKEGVSFEAHIDSGKLVIPWLRGVFVFTSGLIGRNEPVDVENIPTVTLGIRGDAEEIVRDDLLNNPQPLYGDAGIWIETGSPTSVSTIVHTPEDPFDFSFDFTFLDPDTSLTVTLGDTDILTLFSDDFDIGTQESISMLLDWEAFTSELVFTLDGGLPGLGALIYNISFPGVDITSLNDWFTEGNGSAEFVYVTSDRQLNDLMVAATSTSVPIVATHWLFIIGLLGIIGFSRRRK